MAKPRSQLKESLDYRRWTAIELGISGVGAVLEKAYN
jgi:hypothetical protein